MGPVRGVLAAPVRWLGELVGRHPFRAAGVAAVLGGSGAAALSAEGGASLATVAGLLAFAAAQPAYAGAVVAGLVVLFWPGS